jgi:hypothetical protein
MALTAALRIVCSVSPVVAHACLLLVSSGIVSIGQYFHYVIQVFKTSLMEALAILDMLLFYFTLCYIPKVLISIGIDTISLAPAYTRLF